MSETALAKKLHLKTGMRAVVIDPPHGYAERTDFEEYLDLIQEQVGF